MAVIDWRFLAVLLSVRRPIRVAERWLAASLMVNGRLVTFMNGDRSMAQEGRWY
jgi:hypothetical protein